MHTAYSSSCGFPQNWRSENDINLMEYWQCDAACYFLGVYLIVTSLLEQKYHEVAYSLGWIWAYPLLLEICLNLTALVRRERKKSVQGLSRVVYHPGYNYSVWGLEKSHPFDSQRYQRVYAKIVSKNIIQKGKYLKPGFPSRGLLIEQMSPLYLLQLCYGFKVCRLIEAKEWWIPGWIYRWRILNPMLLATEGSILASCAALKLGWSVNLSGGFHHASFTSGEGFCIYPDISLVVHYLQTREGINKIMIIDLDAHQGNGYQKDLAINEGVYIIDCYNSQIFPKDTESRDAINRGLQVKRSTSNQEYLKLIDSIEMDFEFCQPEFVIFNAGTDILEQDPLGELSMTRETVVLRDEKVVGMCHRRRVPVAMLLSGGYQQVNAEVIADSLQNLTAKFC